MDIVLIVLWYVSCFVIGYFVGRAIRKRILKRREIERDFYYQPIVKGGAIEREIQKSSDEMGTMLW